VITIDARCGNIFNTNFMICIKHLEYIVKLTMTEEAGSGKIKKKRERDREKKKQILKLQKL
jgi:hypothetical protein